MSGSGAIATTVSLAAGANATFIVTGTVAASAQGALANTASVAPPSTVTDPDATTNSATASASLTAVADVRITKTGPSAVTPGGTAAYTITITNAGPSATAGVTLNASTPIGLLLAGLTGACTAVPCTISGLAPGESRVIGLMFTVPAAYAGPNLIVVSTTIGSPSDPNPANNTATVSTAVNASADLSIAKTGPATALSGQTVTYTLTISNAGPSDAAGVTVSDPTPPGLTFVSNSGDCTTTFPCALGTMAAGSTRTIVATFATGVAASGSIENRASVASSTSDPSPANDTATVTTEIRPSSVGCDVNGDGLNEIVTGAGPGGGPHVLVWSLAGGVVTSLASFYAYDPLFGGGVFVACGDVDSDGLADVITGAGPGGGPHVRAFSLAGGGVTEIASFFAYAPAFGGGVRVAAGDVDGDGLADIITGAGPSGGPHVRAFSLAGGGVTEVASFYAYDPSFTGGVFVAGGDVNGDGIAEIITGATRAGGPVRVFAIGGPGQVAELASFFAYFPPFQGPVRVAAADVNGDGLADIITGAGPGGDPHIVVWALGGGGLTTLASFYAYPPIHCAIGTDPTVCDSVYVGAGDVTGDGLAEVITGTNRGTGPVRIFQIGPGVIELTSFHPYFEAFRGPVRVAAAMSDHGSPGLSLDEPRHTFLFALNLAHRHAVDTAWSFGRSVSQHRAIRARERSPPA